ncbi:MAG TPA: glycoside hydrolase family 6 protein [Actinomycetes bacterium]|nr:glycoside hydrolase family 6 protein [Actinomycetes bacterium]
MAGPDHHQAPGELADQSVRPRQAPGAGAPGPGPAGPAGAGPLLHPDRGCSSSRDGAPSARGYDRWIRQLIHNLGSTRAAIILEPDAVPADCFGPHRAALLKRNVKRLADAGQYVYLDAGHVGWRSSGEMAQRLLDSGVQYAQGFSVNVSNRQTTKLSYQWGRELSDLIGNREFVIDTSRNGLGPPPDEPGRDDEWCNPLRQALGQPPTTRTTAAGLGALLWIKPPGESDGICRGEHTYLFSPTQARRLIPTAARCRRSTGGSRSLSGRARRPSPGSLRSDRYRRKAGA